MFLKKIFKNISPCFPQENPVTNSASVPPLPPIFAPFFHFKRFSLQENYYIKKYYGDFVLLKRAKNKENCKKVLEKVGVYGTLREVKEANIKEMIKDEVNHRKTEPLYKLIPLMRQMYNRFYEENMECCFVG